MQDQTILYSCEDMTKNAAESNLISNSLLKTSWELYPSGMTPSSGASRLSQAFHGFPLLDTLTALVTV